MSDCIFQDRFVDVLGPVPGARMLDVAGGTGEGGMRGTMKGKTTLKHEKEKLNLEKKLLNMEKKIINLKK